MCEVRDMALQLASERVLEAVAAVNSEALKQERSHEQFYL